MTDASIARHILVLSVDLLQDLALSHQQIYYAVIPDESLASYAHDPCRPAREVTTLA